MRKIYIHASSRDYLSEEYKKYFLEQNAAIYLGDQDNFKEFLSLNKERLQLDTETNVVDHYIDRELYIVQLGNVDGSEQHIFDIKDCEDTILETLKELFSSNTEFLAHGAIFEYIVLKAFFEVDIKNFLCTMLMSRLITSGLDLESGYNSLAGLLKNRFGLDVSKASQTSFTGEMMSPEQLLYADTDVLYLDDLYKDMLPALTRWKMVKKFKLECKTLRALGDMTSTGMLVNTDALAENVILYEDTAAEDKSKIITALLASNEKGTQDTLKELNIIQGQDEVVINWRSSVQKRTIMCRLLPELEIVSTAKAAIKKLSKDNDSIILSYFLLENYDKIIDILISRHIDFLKENGMYLTKGDLNINFNSDKQLLELFKIWYPKLTSVGVKAIKKLKHPVVMAYKKYAKSNKAASSFGSKMYTYIESDGRIRTSFNQLVPSGSRMSCKKPNLQQSPSTEQYRRIYIPRVGWSLVDSDYSSAEVYIAAFLSQDKNMLHAVKMGYDLHSYSAYQIFGQRWLDAGGSAEPMGKPDTKEANAMRKQSKGASFSLFYGTGVVAFSENNGMTTAEGKVIIKAYYDKFPQLTKFFKESGEFALSKYYIREPFFGGVRFFNKPKNGMEVSHLKNAAMNYKPQSGNSSIMKYALCLIKSYIDKHKVGHKVVMLITVHDQVVSAARDDYAAEWGVIQTSLLEKAAKYAIPDGSLKAETMILKHWTK